MILETRNLIKHYKDADRELSVIESLTVSFKAPSTVAIVGPSGVGKSTLMHLLGGLDRPTSGSIHFDGTDISTLNDDDLSKFRGRHVGFVFQFHHLLPEFTAVENVAMPLIISGTSETLASERAKEELYRVGLKERLSHLPSELSGGEQQRVAVARALVHKPKVLLADEPTGNLDSASAKTVREILISLSREAGSLLIVVTHSQELAAAMDEVREMEAGGALSAKKL